MTFRGQVMAVTLVLAVTATHTAISAILTPSLPTQLTLDYTLHYGQIIIGHVVKTLKRQKNGNYYHSTWTRPAGLAKVFTNVQFVEQGTFTISGRRPQPLSFADTKTGDGHDYRREAIFNYPMHRLVFAHAPTKPLPPGTQDLDTVFYLFMLNPVKPGMRKRVYVTNGKDVKPYWFVYRRSEMMMTPWGKLKTYLVSRMSRSDWEAEKRCTTPTPACRARFHAFEIWVAPALQDVPVRLRQRQHGHTLTLTITYLSRS